MSDSPDNSNFPRHCGRTLRLSEQSSQQRSGADFLKPRHKWFYAWFRDADRWQGPYDSMEDAVQALASDGDWRLAFLTQGRKLKKSERDKMGVDYEWEVSGNLVFKISQVSP